METHGNDNPDLVNRRASPRARTLRRATIILKGGNSTFDCVVRNMSATGAMLQVGPLGIPIHFELAIDTVPPHHLCTVRWRAENAIGVSFDDVAQAA